MVRCTGFLGKYSLVSFFLLVAVFVIAGQTVYASTIQSYSDTISNSAPGASSNHTINFTTTAAIPTGGYVRFRPNPGDFTIPAANFDIDNVELYVATSSGFQVRAATTSPSASRDGVVITTGTSGQIEVTLNSTVPIPAGAQVRMLIGTNTTNATGTDVGITNPSATTSYPIYIETGGSTDVSVNTYVAIVYSVGVGPVDTSETIPPVRFNGAPSGTLSGTVQNVELSLETDEFARCRYSTASNTPYFSMTKEFNGSNYTTVHTKDVAVATSTAYTFYVRCIDDEGNVNIDDYAITFTIPDFPTGEPGPSGSEEGEGSGTGSGSGSSDPGDGAPSGSDSSSGGSSGGGAGGGGGGGSGSSSGGDGGSGGFEGTDNPYQSGDAQVIISGYAFPNSTVIILVDGVRAQSTQANSSGLFSVTLDAIARGVYNFGIYAIDRNSIHSSTFTTTFSVIGSRASSLSNVNVMPSIRVEPDPVNPGETLTLSGYAIPNATLSIENQKDKSGVTLKSFTTTSASNGAWSLDVDTASFSAGTWKVRAKSEQQGGLLIKTGWSDYTYYGVGQTAAVPSSSDLNSDGSVNLIDFSILLFWWNTDGGSSNPSADINSDGQVSLTDFSIMIFNWTG